MMPLRAPQKILVIKLGALGDFIQALGPMRAIRNHHDSAHITLLTTPAFADMAQKSAHFDAIQIDQKPRWYHIPAWLRLRHFLNQQNFDRIYDLQNNDRTNFYFKLLHKRNRPEWVGAAKGASHENSSLARIKGHAFDGHAQTLSLAGIEDIEIDDLGWLADDVSNFDISQPYALLVPGSSPQHLQKRWPAKQYGRLAQELYAQKIQPVILGTAHEHDCTHKIIAQCPQAISLIGKTTISQIIGLAQNAKIAIGNDTGPIHIIAAAGCHTIALFSGFSNLLKHKPLGKNVSVIQEENLSTLKLETVLKHISAHA